MAVLYGGLRPRTRPLGLRQCARFGRVSTAKLRLLAAVRRVCRELGGRVPSKGAVDALLDERADLTGFGSAPGPRLCHHGVMEKHSKRESPRTTGLTVRLPAELADVLRNYAFLTDTSANEVIKRALTEYIKAHSRAEMMQAAFDRVAREHRVALDKLEDM